MRTALSLTISGGGDACPGGSAQGGVCIKPDTPINVYTRFCLNTAKSKFSLVSPVADW